MNETHNRHIPRTARAAPSASVCQNRSCTPLSQGGLARTNTSSQMIGVKGAMPTTTHTAPSKRRINRSVPMSDLCCGGLNRALIPRKCG